MSMNITCMYIHTVDMQLFTFAMKTNIAIVLFYKECNNSTIYLIEVHMRQLFLNIHDKTLKLEKGKL